MLKALTLCYRWWNTWKTFPVMSWVKAAACYRRGSFAEAERLYKKGIDLNPNHPARFSARVDLAYCLFKEQKFVEAEEQLRYVSVHSPSSREAHVRLAKIQMWMGHALDAAWTMRRALGKITPDSEMVALFILAVVENGGPLYLLREAMFAYEKLSPEQRMTPLLEAAQARLSMLRGEDTRARVKLEKIATMDKAPFEAVLLFAEFLLREGRISDARDHLRTALAVCPDHPRVLSLLAESYLKSGDSYSPDYARQLATSACQNTNWSSPRDMHVLAESNYHVGDKISALLIASKAKEVGSRLLGTYRDVKNLEKLIETLSSGTQA